MLGRSKLSQYFVAIVSSLISLALTWLIQFRLGEVLIVLPLAALVLTALYGGMRPALLTYCLILIGADYWFLSPGTLAIYNEKDQLKFGLLAGLGALVTLFCAL